MQRPLRSLTPLLLALLAPIACGSGAPSVANAKGERPVETAPAPSASAPSAAPLRVHTPERGASASAPWFDELLRTAPALALVTLRDCPADCRGGVTELVAVDAAEMLRGVPFVRAAGFFENQSVCRQHERSAWLVAVKPTDPGVVEHPDPCDEPARPVHVDAEVLGIAAFDSAESARRYVAGLPPG